MLHHEVNSWKFGFRFQHTPVDEIDFVDNLIDHRLHVQFMIGGKNEYNAFHP